MVVPLMSAFALLVLFYWFRHNCGAILKRKTSDEAARQVAAANQLNFPEIQDQLDNMSGSELDSILRTLQRDYSVLICLLRYTSPLPDAPFTWEQRLLMVNFRFLESWHSVAGRISESATRHTLSEMCSVCNHFANCMSERSVLRT